MRTLLSLVLSLFCGPVLAHALAPSMLHLQAPQAAEPWVYPVLLRQDIGSAPLRVVWPDTCQVGSETLQRTARQIDRKLELSCTTPLDGQRLQIDGLSLRSSALLLRDDLSPGGQTRLISAREPQIRLGQASETIWLRYLMLGGEHLVSGWDHLLLVLGLFWLAGSWHRMIGLATAFTLGHSLTLATTVLDLWRLPSPWVEFTIALTLVWLALRLGRPNSTHKRYREYPVICAFGLIHGMGFASALMQIGLPDNALLQALFAFNLGIELGQILILAALTVVYQLIRRVRASWAPQFELASAYCMGSLAMFWLLERSPALLN